MVTFSSIPTLEVALVQTRPVVLNHSAHGAVKEHNALLEYGRNL